MSIIQDMGLVRYLSSYSTLDMTDKISEHCYTEGMAIYTPPMRSLHVYEVKQGYIKLGNVSAEGNETTHELLEAGDLFGYLHEHHEEQDAFARALTPVTVQRYDWRFFRHVVVTDPQVSAWFYDKLVERWNNARSRLFLISNHPPADRIHHLQQQLESKQLPDDPPSRSLLTLITQQDIADLTATSRQAVARVFNCNTF
ncbi:Crp/Fnr family transcriptional regulator [Chitinophaga pendula]|uniref:Crp/Fnr family transcriptional regulator n=1 Tax=Chitinophaga TaxID=79328 RepID=UPI0012FE05FC|nr:MULTISPECIES: Crp/Fnr family transcriptional regulator [Chitinophaga]UCJ08002.1 Crp/Fnr family transcriptional regulator [Chitinophaga pendula]